MKRGVKSVSAEWREGPRIIALTANALQGSQCLSPLEWMITFRTVSLSHETALERWGQNPIRFVRCGPGDARSAAPPPLRQRPPSTELAKSSSI